MKKVIALLLLAAPLAAPARPFRAMVTRTAETTGRTSLELGLRWQGFFAGRGLFALPYDELSPGLRFGIGKGLELDVGVDFLLLDLPGTPGFRAYLGEVPLGLQWTFLESRFGALGVYLGGAVPLGPGDIDIIPPSLPDGALDLEGTLIAELRPARWLRFMFNAGYLFHGTRAISPGVEFDVPDALRYDAAATVNLGEWVLLGVELVGLYYLRPEITPAWTDNANQVEVLPHARFEVAPRFVIEAALGFALTPGLMDIYRVRGLLGFTYEFDFR